MAGGKKKRNHPDVEDLLQRPFCYYCERDFDDLKILISHQKAKHFKCERCGRRLNTIGGLSVHMNQVHKETLTTVENALGNRAGIDLEIFGMEGIPEDIAQAHNQRIISQFYQAEAERRAATGNPGPGASGGQGVAKKPKFESPSDLKKRLAEHKARMAEQATAGGSSGGNTPAGLNGSPAQTQSPAPFNAAPFPPPSSGNYGAPPGTNFGTFSQEPYSQPTLAYQAPFPQQPGFSPPGQYQSQQYSQSPSFPPPGAYPAQSFPGAPPGYNQFQAPASQAPPHGLPSRPPNLPQPSGLPQRPQGPGLPLPVYGAPPMGHYPASQGWNGPDHHNQAMSSAYPPHSQGFNPNMSSVDDLISSASARQPDDIDELIRMAEAGIKPPKKFEAPPPNSSWASPAGQIPQTSTLPVPPVTTVEPVSNGTPKIAAAAGEDAGEKKSSKKDKDKNTKMVYSDNDISPEEKMAKLNRYAFVPDVKEDTPVADVPETVEAKVVEEQVAG